MKEKSVLVVAFDGLDRELIEDFGLDTFTDMEEFGLIDNNTNTYKRKTSELFTSFITGKNYGSHEITELWKFSNEKINKFEKIVDDLPFTNSFKGIRHALYQKILRFDCTKRMINKNDYPQKTLFEKIDNSRAFNIPGYNPSPFWSKVRSVQLAEHDLEDRIPGYYWDVHEYRRRKNQFFSEISGYEDLVMAHFHRSDIHQHQYGDKDVFYDVQRLEKLYKETEELAKNIIERYENDFDVIIFMSDHGLPTEDQHNKQAFYSCNIDLFSDKTPKITSFHDQILSLTSENPEIIKESRDV